MMGTNALAVIVDQPLPAATEGGSPARTGGAAERPAFVVPALMADIICATIADGNSLVGVCREIGVPDSTVDGWVLKDPNFAARYEHARRKRFDRMAEECLYIADDRSQDDIIDDKGYRRPNKEWIARSRVRIQTRLDLLARWDPKRYGAKLELNGEINTRSLNLHFDGGDVDAARAYADLMRGRPAGPAG